jgi:ATPase subunit of ABC transporter with duplicated ATPase domains
MALLAARDLSKTHASIPLFERLSITFHPSERVGLIGPNGGGKTTLLKILAGAEHADSGVVERAKSARLGLRRSPDGSGVDMSCSCTASRR